MSLRSLALLLALCAAPLAAQPLTSLDLSLPASRPRIDMSAPRPALKLAPAVKLDRLQDSPLTPEEQRELQHAFDNDAAASQPGLPPPGPVDGRQLLRSLQQAFHKPDVVPMHELPPLPLQRQ